MKILTIDFETFYSQAYSLTKLTTEEYVRGDEFEVIGVAVQQDDGEPVWFSGTRKETKEFLQQFDFENNIALAHNAMFDGAILGWYFGINPKGWLDTLCMARALHGTEVGGSLKVLAEKYQLGVKGDEVIAALGKKRGDFSADSLAKYGEYCRNDVSLTYKLFNSMADDFPKSELRLIDLTIKMYSEPVLFLDGEKLGVYKTELEEAKARLMEGLGVERETLQSNPQFAELLTSLGVLPPKKTSLTTGKETLAFAKNDEEFKALLEHEDPRVQALVAARLGIKSTLEEARTQRFMDIASRGAMPVPLRYYAAHTGRWGGDDKINLQNLPRNAKLKFMILPPEGHAMIDSDSSQIEARTLAWLAQQDDLVEAFDKGEDVYKKMASAIYSKPESEIVKSERFVGKTTILGCIAEGTLVLSDSGWKPIEAVTIQDKLWDGEGWVCHQGLVTKGYKQTLSVCGSWLTPDHQILCGTQWKEAQYVVADESILSLALGTGAANSPLQGTLKAREGVSQHSLCDATAAHRNTPSITKTLRISGVRAAINALKQQAQVRANCTGVTAKFWRMTHIEKGCLIESLASFLDAAQRLVRHIRTTVGEVLQYTQLGLLIERNFCGISSTYPVGMTQAGISTAWTIPRVMNPAIYGSQQKVRTLETSEKSKFCSRNLMTYDIAYAGPNNRFMIATDAGPLIVHNCGYGMGAAKFQAQLKAYGVELSEEECKRIVSVYRQTYPHIPALWAQANTALKAIMRNVTAPIGRPGAVVVMGKQGIVLPNGLAIKYPNLREHTDEDSGKTELVYDVKKGKTFIPNRIYGGKVVENVCQALARIVIGEQMLQVAKKYRVVMTVHDAIACIAPHEELDVAKAYVEACMRSRPAWAPDLPLDCETGYGESYGDC